MTKDYSLTTNNQQEKQLEYIEDDEIKKDKITNLHFDKQETTTISVNKQETNDFNENNIPNCCHESGEIVADDAIEQQKEEQHQDLKHKEKDSSPLTSSTAYKLENQNNNNIKEDSINYSLTNLICSSNSLSATNTNNEIVQSVLLNKSTSSSPLSSQTIKQTSIASTFNDKMSPGLAKRITSNTSTNEITPSSSSSSSSNKKVTDPKKQIKASNSNSNNIAQVKIQNALDRNMQKLKLHSNKLNNHQATNLSREDIELFSSPSFNVEMLEESKQQNISINGDYFTSDSLSSTPEHYHNSNGKLKQQNEQISKKTVEMTAYFLDRLPLPLNLNNSKLINNIGREMTPDSIDNNSSDNNDNTAAINSIQHRRSQQQSQAQLAHRKQQHHHHVHQNNKLVKQQIMQQNANKIKRQSTNTSASSLISNNQINRSVASLSSSCSSSSSLANKPKQQQNHLLLMDRVQVTNVSSSAPSCSSSTSSALSSPILQQQQHQKQIDELQLQQTRQKMPKRVINSTASNQMKTMMKTTTAAATAVMSKAFKMNQNYNLINTNQQKSVSLRINGQLPPKKHLLKTTNNKNSKTNKIYSSGLNCDNNNKIMPVVEEGLSNDEVNEQDIDDDDDQYYEDYDEEDDDEGQKQVKKDNSQYFNKETVNKTSNIKKINKQTFNYNTKNDDEDNDNDDNHQEFEQDYEYEVEYEEEYEEECDEYEENNNKAEGYYENEHNVYFNDSKQTSSIVYSKSDHSVTASTKIDVSKKQLNQQQINQSKIKHQNSQRVNPNKTAPSMSMYTSSSASSSSSTIKSLGPSNPQQTSAINSSCSLYSVKGNDFNQRKNEIDYDTDEETNKLLDSNNNNGENLNHNHSKASTSNQRQRQHNKISSNTASSFSSHDDKLMQQNNSKDPENMNQQKSREINVHQIMDPDNQVLIEGVLFRARYLGSTQLVTDGNPTKLTRMLQAQEAVGRIKAPEGESQPSVEVDLFVSTEKIMVLNTDLQEIMMDHSLRSISYIADIGNLVVLMAKRRAITNSGNDSEACAIKRQVKMVCHVFESDEAQIVAQSIGQAFQVAYMEYLKANGIEDMSIMKDLDYQEVLNQQEIMGDELVMFAKKECQKEVIIPKAKNEILGVVIVESGWGSMLPTVVVANMMPTGPAARCGHLNIGDQIISVNGISMVGLPLSACQAQIKNAKHLTLVRLVVVPCPPVVEVLIKRPDTKYQLGFSVQDGIICSLLRGGIAERGGVRVGHRIIEINNQSVVATTHEKIVSILANSVGELRMKTMPTQMFRLLTGQEVPVYI